jgi:iron transport multicopper oxidase
MFSIDGHNLTIIEADGQLTKPVTVNQIQIFAAQRYSFILEATQPVDNYWIRALPNVNSAEDPTFNNGLNSGILRYDGAPTSEPTTNSSALVPLNETQLHPFSDPAAPGTPEQGAADVVQPMQLGFNGRNFTVNDIQFVNPPLPVLLQILSGAQTPQDLLPSGSVYPLPKNKVIEITLMGGNAVGGPHPFHLHGVSGIEFNWPISDSGLMCGLVS